eukprot:TRINITY_DN16519_c0_g1_i1.p1 TRINITY_DN16519_c0_g1~~TRINITY_DN16519_c0_g1_i1.p1  ORF type:complete len:340 (+),score=52.96 TRINITY_DN16519_c0_g1_i1:149-1168(+)
MNRHLTRVDELCLAAIFGDNVAQFAAMEPDQLIEKLVIKPAHFALFLKRFGPLPLCLKKTFCILTEGRVWFHGNIDKNEALSLLHSGVAKEKAVLVRYSASRPEAFSVQYIQNSGMRIFNGISNNTAGDGILVESKKATLRYSSFSGFLERNAQLFGLQLAVAARNDSFLERMKRLIWTRVELGDDATGGLVIAEDPVSSDDEELEAHHTPPDASPSKSNATSMGRPVPTPTRIPHTGLSNLALSPVSGPLDLHPRSQSKTRRGAAAPRRLATGDSDQQEKQSPEASPPPRPAKSKPKAKEEDWQANKNKSVLRAEVAKHYSLFDSDEEEEADDDWTDL